MELSKILTFSIALFDIFFPLQKNTPYTLQQELMCTVNGFHENF